MKKLFFLLLPSLFLSGCVAMNNDFDCNKIGGIRGCVSLDEVNSMTDQGTLGQKQSSKTTNTTTNRNISGYLNGIPNIGEPVRFGDTIQQVTIFPYEDTDGNYHEASVIYSVLKQSHWIAHPPKAIQTSDLED